MPDRSFERRPITIVFNEAAAFKDTYGGAVGLVALQGQWLRPDTASDTILISMHPIGGTAGLPVMKQFAQAGVHVLACDSRYRGADYALIMEKVAVHLGAAVRFARETLGYARVVLLGWSGGGALSAFYQAQAEAPTVTATPAGDGPDLTHAELLPADAVVLMAAHVSRHRTLTEWLDASIDDEADPDCRNANLDIYNRANGPPFTDDFVERYRAAQIERNRRLTSWVRGKLTSLKAQGRGGEEFAFVVHGTMADPRWLDPSVDPNDRRPGWCYLGDPRTVNMSPIGLARFSSLRSWLSQWSYDEAQGDGPGSLRRVSRPVLVINNSADDACTPSHAYRLFEAVQHTDKAFEQIAGATHYYLGQPELSAQAVSVVRRWLQAHDFGV